MPGSCEKGGGSASPLSPGVPLSPASFTLSRSPLRSLALSPLVVQAGDVITDNTKTDIKRDVRAMRPPQAQNHERPIGAEVSGGKAEPSTGATCQGEYETNDRSWRNSTEPAPAQYVWLLMAKARFRAELIEGHEKVTVVMVPFDPEEVWRQKPVRLDPRRDGWLIKGTANGAAFSSYVGYRWGKFFIIIEPAVRAAAGAGVGDTLEMVVEPSLTSKTLAKARALSQVTTAPKKGRADAIELPAGRRRTMTSRS
jgi:hypothetical protein